MLRKLFQTTAIVAAVALEMRAGTVPGIVGDSEAGGLGSRTEAGGARGEPRANWASGSRRQTRRRKWFWVLVSLLLSSAQQARAWRVRAEPRCVGCLGLLPVPAGAGPPPSCWSFLPSGCP